MATATLNPTVASTEDRSIILQHTSLKMMQSFALLTPPLLIAHSLYRKSFRVSHFLRNTAVSTFVLGGVAGYGMGYGKLMGMDAEAARDRATRIRMNAGQVRVDDWSIVGGVLGAIIAPTLFLRSARAPILVLGGAALGVSGGTIAHIVKNFQEGKDQSPEMMVEEAKSLVKGGQ